MFAIGWHNSLEDREFLLGKLQSEFGQSANSMMDNAGTLKMIDAKVASFTVPPDFENKAEFGRRAKEGLQRLLGDEYMLSVQNQTGFNLKQVLDGLPKTETPTTLNERAATIENRVVTAGEIVDPTRRLRSATMDIQQKYLEDAATALRDEKIKSGTVAADGQIKDMAKNTYKGGLVPADVANYAALTEGVEIPKDTIAAVASIKKPDEKKPDPAPTPAPAVVAAPAPG